MKVLSQKSLYNICISALLLSAAIPLTRGTAASSYTGSLSPPGGLGSSSEIDPQSGPFDLGTGYYSLAGLPRGKCVVPGELKTIEGGGRESGQDVSFTLKELTSYQELHDELEVKAGGAFGVGTFEGSAKTAFYKSSSFSRYNYFLLVKVRVHNETEFLADYQLTENARNLLESGDTAGFLVSCGNEFIASVNRGGEFAAIIEIETSSDEDKKKLQAELKLSNIGWSAHSEVARTLESISKKHSLKTHIIRRGPKESIELAPLEVIEYAKSFPTKVGLTPGSQPWAYKANTLDYGVILNIPRGTAGFNVQKRVMNAMVFDLASALENRNSVSYVLLNPSQFKDPDLKALNQYQADLSSYINRLNLAFTTCAEAPESACFFDPALKAPSVVPLPERVTLNREVTAIAFGDSSCRASDPNRCVGLKNDGNAFDTGIRVVPGDFLELTPSFLMTESLADAPAMKGRKISHPVQVPYREKVCTIRHGEDVCRTVTKYRSEDHWTQTTSYPGLTRSSQVSSGPEASMALAENLGLRFVWRNEEGAPVTTTCRFTDFESAAEGDLLHVRIENRPKCAVFPADETIHPRVFLVNLAPAKPVTYHVGKEVQSWKGVLERPRTLHASPVSVVAGQIRVH